MSCQSAHLSPSGGATIALPTEIGGEPIVYNTSTGPEIALLYPDGSEVAILKALGRPPSALQVRTGFTSEQVGFTSEIITVSGVAASDLLELIIAEYLPKIESQRIDTIAGKTVTRVRLAGTTSDIVLYPTLDTVAILTARNPAHLAEALSSLP